MRIFFLKEAIYRQMSDIFSWGSNWQLVLIDAGNGLVLNKWQAITWTNDDTYSEGVA